MLWNLRTAARPEPGHGASEAGASGRPRIGIAFGSGAARGWSHIGVIQRLQDAGLEPDVVTGTSVGALVGGCNVAGCLDALEDFARGLTKRRVFGLLDVAWRGGGVISGDKLSDLLRQEVGDTRIENLPRRFACVATELATGHEIWLQRGRLVDAMRASYALPGVFKPVFLHSRWLIDGAVVDPIPVSVCRALGARLVIAVNLNSDVYSAGTIIQAPHRDSEDGRAGSSPSGKARNATLRQLFGRTETGPGLTGVLVAAFNISQDRLARSRLAGDPPDIVIAPRGGDIGLFDFDKADESIRLGREAAERALPLIEEAIEVLR